MSKHFFVIVTLYISSVVFARNDFNTLNDDELNENRAYESKDNAEYLDLKRRKEIVKKYLDTLENGKETWINPNDMIGDLKDEHQPLILNAASSSSLPNEPSVNNDHKKNNEDLQAFSGSKVNTNQVFDSKDNAADLEIKRRKEIVKKYLDTIEGGKETVVNLNDLTDDIKAEHQPLFLNPATSSSLRTEQSVSNEHKKNNENLRAFRDSKINTKQVSDFKNNAVELEIKRKKVSSSLHDEPRASNKKSNDDLQSFSNSKMNTKQVSGSKDNAEDLEIKRKKEIAKKYLDSLEQKKETWVNPHDMIVDRIDQYQPKTTDASATLSVSNKPSDYNHYNSVLNTNKGEVICPDTDYANKDELFASDKHRCALNCIYISRWLKKLISKIEDEPEFESLSISLNSEFIDDLKAISNARTLEVSDLDENICNLIEKLTILKQNRYSLSIESMYESNLGIRFSVFIVICLAGYIFYKCLKHRPVLTLIGCFLFVCIAWHWMHLYKKQIAIKHSKLAFDVPSECRKSEFGLLESMYSYIKSYFATNNCAEYYEALMVDPFWEVSLSMAISEALAAVIFQPLYSGSKAVNVAVKQLFNELSLANTVILVVFLFLMFVMCFNYKIRLPLFMGTLEPGHVKHNYVEDVQHTRPYNMLRDEVCRSLPNLQESQPNRNITPRLESSTFNNENVSKAECCVSKCENIINHKLPCSKSKHNESVSKDDCCVSKCECVTNYKIPFNDDSKKETVNCIHSIKNTSESKVEEKKTTLSKENLDSVKETTYIEDIDLVMGSSEMKPNQKIESDLEKNANTCENICGSSDSILME